MTQMKIKKEKLNKQDWVALCLGSIIVGVTQFKTWRNPNSDIFDLLIIVCIYFVFYISVLCVTLYAIGRGDEFWN